ncbi:hypothetical protein CJ030_MR0G008573 [Morella rubra]|uniref:Uncharacterized protein n=1 Tax=Morella rubra TaxID=262757 RepID=A0A6A1UHY7_9ROSI|nr:hypothetical protein CJ030_MR0G008573 [Morella rubra]
MLVTDESGPQQRDIEGSDDSSDSLSKIVVIPKNMTPRTKDDVMPAVRKRLQCDSGTLVRAGSTVDTVVASGPSLRDCNEVPPPTTTSPIGTKSSCASNVLDQSRKGSYEQDCIKQGSSWRKANCPYP